MAHYNIRIRPDSPVYIAQQYITVQAYPYQVYPHIDYRIDRTARELFANLTAMYDAKALSLSIYLECACYNRKWVKTHQKEFQGMIGTLITENRSPTNEAQQVAKAIHQNWSHLSQYFPKDMTLQGKKRRKVNHRLFTLQTDFKTSSGTTLKILNPKQTPLSTYLLKRFLDYIQTGTFPPPSGPEDLKYLDTCMNLFITANYWNVTPLAQQCDKTLSEEVFKKAMSWKFNLQEVASIFELARYYGAKKLTDTCIQIYLEMVEKELLSVDDPQLLDQDVLDILVAALVQGKEVIMNRCVSALTQRWKVGFHQVIPRHGHLNLSSMGEASEKRLIAVIKAFRGMKQLTLCNLPHATSAVIKALVQNNPGLQDLVIEDCPNAIFRSLTVCKNLDRLCIHNGTIGDACVREIVRFAPNLRVLDLINCPVTDRCFLSLKRLGRLEILWLRDCSEIGHYPSRLSLLPKTCRSICLNSCRHVTDAALKSLQETNIEKVGILDTDVTEEGVFDFVTHKPVFFIGEWSSHYEWSLSRLNIDKIDSLIFLLDWTDGYKRFDEYARRYYTSFWSMWDEDLIAIAKRIPEDNRIETLCLGSERITGVGVRAIVEKCPHLRKAALGQCTEVDDETRAWVRERCDANRKPS